MGASTLTRHMIYEGNTDDKVFMYDIDHDIDQTSAEIIS